MENQNRVRAGIKFAIDTSKVAIIVTWCTSIRRRHYREELSEVQVGEILLSVISVATFLYA